MRIRNLEALTNHGNIDGRKAICQILETGLEAADPYYNTSRLVSVDGNKIRIGCKDFEPIDDPKSGDDVYEFGKDIDRVFIFGAGKGIMHAARALEEKLGDHLTGGVIIVKYGDEVTVKNIEVVHAGHPIPDENCVKGCNRMIECIENAKLTERDLVFTIIGNGVSSLLTLPADGVALNAVQQVVHMLQIEKGVGTAELSFIRNQVDKLKGGRITRLLRPAKMVHILAVDCNYRNTGAVGFKGLMYMNIWLHTMPDASSPEAAIGILKKYDAWDRTDDSIKQYLLTEAKNHDVLKAPEYFQMDCRVFGVMPDAIGFIPSAMAKAKEMGFEPHLISRNSGYEASQAGKFMAGIGTLCSQEGTPFKAPCALFMTGEMVVTVGKNGGVGGRNQEFALSAATAIAGNTKVVIGAVDTDATDGPGGYFNDEAKELGIQALAGGVVDGMLMAEAKEKGVDILGALRTHATSDALWKTDCGVWATQNISLQDLIVVLVTE